MKHVYKVSFWEIVSMPNRVCLKIEADRQVTKAEILKKLRSDTLYGDEELNLEHLWNDYDFGNSESIGFEETDVDMEEIHEDKKQETSNEISEGSKSVR